MPTAATVYKICEARAWRAAMAAGAFHGAGDDVRDGFIHLSTAAQLAETARRHFAGKTGLVLIALDAAALGAALRWEPSRGGALFPHLYAPLTGEAVIGETPLPLADDGTPQLPERLP